MKTLPAIIAIALGLALVLVPAVSFAAGSITFSSPAPGSSYKGTQSYTIAGTVSPAPNVADNVFITVKNPSGTTVDAASVSVTPSTGAFSYSTATGGSAYWVTGTYKITATDSYGATGTITFSYTAAPAPTTGPAVSLVVSAVASSPIAPGSTVGVSVLVQWSNGTLVNKVSFAGSHYHNPSGTPTALGSPASVGPGMFWFTISLPSNSATGLYAVHIKANASGTIAWAQAGFTVADLATGSSQSAIQTSLTGITNTLTGVTNSLTSITNSLSSISGALSTLQTTANNAATQAQNAATQASNAASAVSSTQTYVLVVAVLAAITLVLELAILVRKLS